MRAAAGTVDVLILGSGTSHGVPMIGCECAVCRSNDPRDRRSRPSALVRFGGVQMLIDTAPELRLQCIDHHVSHVDAVLFTHHHADHVAGLDDLRRFNWLTRKTLPIYGSERTLANIRRMFLYAFEAAPDSPHSRPNLAVHPIDARAFEIAGAAVIPIPLMHGPLPILGFRFGRFAYCTDCSSIPPESMERLAGLEVLVLNALRIDPHPAHLNLEQAVRMAEQVGARRTYFTHMTHQLGHAATNRGLPEGLALAYDGLRFTVE